MNASRGKRVKRSSTRERRSVDGLRARQKRDKRERLRAAAWELFASRGFDDTTTREIAERAGIATGTLFLYASDKSDLLFLVFEHRLAETVDGAFRSLPRGSLKDELMFLFGRVFAMYDRSPDLARRFVKELPGAQGPNAGRVNAMTFAFLGRLGGLVEEAAKRGEVRADVPPLLAAQTVFAVYYAGLLTWLFGFDSLDGALTTTVSSGFDLLLRGLEPR